MSFSGGSSLELARYANVPQLIGTLCAKKIATLSELQTVYSVRDAYDLLEIVIVTDYNHALSGNKDA